MTNVTPGILFGDLGTRLWPLSRAGLPKQFLSLTGNENWFQQASQQLVALGADDVRVSKPPIGTGEEHRLTAFEPLHETGIELGAALPESVGRNTAPALMLVLPVARAGGDDTAPIVVPTDQKAVNTSALMQATPQAIHETSGGGVVTLHITPDSREAGYGYIHGQAQTKVGVMSVARFVDKPNPDTARRYLDEGGYYWDAGVFALRASVWRNTSVAVCLDVHTDPMAACNGEAKGNTFVRPGEAESPAITSEYTNNPVAGSCPGQRIPHQKGSDGSNGLGTQGAVWKLLPKDDQCNAHSRDVLTTDSRISLVHASSRLFNLIGVEGLIVTEIPDAMLVPNKTRPGNSRAFSHSSKPQNAKRTPCTALEVGTTAPTRRALQGQADLG